MSGRHRESRQSCSAKWWPASLQNRVEQAVEAYEFLGAKADLNRVPAGVPGLRHQARVAQQAPAGGQRASAGGPRSPDTELKATALVEEGLSNPDIAARLMLSRQTVATYVSHILKKLNVATRTARTLRSARRGRIVTGFGGRFQPCPVHAGHLNERVVHRRLDDSGSHRAQGTAGCAGIVSG